MSLRPPPGPRLGGGRVRVDAARAIAKLREYQLVDRTAWILEAVRAAIASGATAVTVRGDANDVWLTWAGPPWPAADLTGLFDHLVSPEPARSSHHLRLLATAVNSALGLDPAHVDVVTVSEARVAARVRYTPAVLAEPVGADEDAPLRHLRAVTGAVPYHVPGPGMAVHLRRPAGWDTLTYFLRGEPPELTLAREACADCAVPITIGTTALGRDRHDRDRVRVPLGEGLDGFVALVDPDAPRPADPRAMLEIAERGVLLATYPLDLPELFAPPRAPVPLRLFVDAERMPTNASRSEVRRGSQPIASAEARAGDAIAALIALVADQLAGDDAPAPLRDAALALLAAAVAGSDWATAATELGRPLDRLAALPLVTSATGEARPVRAGWRAGVVHTGDDALPVELAPWLGRVMWLRPGDGAARLLGGQVIDRPGARRLIRHARRQHRARTRFLDHAPRSLTVRPRAPVRVRIDLAAAAAQRAGAIPATWLGGVTGELALVDDPRGAEIVLVVQGREIETVRRAAVLSYQAVVSAPFLAPADRYRGAARDRGYDLVLQAVHGAAIRAVEALARHAAGRAVPAGTTIAVAPDPAELAELVTAAVAVLQRHDLDVDRSPLADAAIWPTAGGGTTSLTALTGASVVGLTRSGARFTAPAGRSVVVVDGTARAVLRRHLEHRTTLVDYAVDLAPSSDRAADHAQWLIAGGADVALAVHDDQLAGAIAPAERAVLRVAHMGVVVESRPVSPALAPAIVVADSDRVIPDDDWRTLVFDDGLGERGYADWETALARALAGELTGQRQARLFLRGARLAPDDPAAGFLWQALAADEAGPRNLLGDDLTARLRAHPLFPVLGGGPDDLVAADQLATRFAKGPIPYLPPTVVVPPGVDDWQPPVIEAEQARALARLLGRRVVVGTKELDQRARAARRRTRLAALREAPLLADLTPASSPNVPVASGKRTGTVAVHSGDELAVDVTIEGHWLVRLTARDTLPLHAIIDVPEADGDAELTGVRDRAARELTDIALASAPALIRHVADSEPAALIDDDRVLRLVLRWLERGPVEADTRIHLTRTRAFVTLKGERASIHAATRDGSVLVATWSGDWLAEPDAPHDLDRPILRIPEPDGGLLALIERLSTLSCRDVTDLVTRLQAQRRVKHGLVPVPTVPGASPVWTRSLDELGPGGAALGPGQATLVEGSSLALLHATGVRTGTLDVDVEPAVIVAIEAPDLALAVTGGGAPTHEVIALTARIQEVAVALAGAVLAAQPADSLPAWVRRHLRRALLGGRMAPSLVTAPVFETTAGDWVGWDALVEQQGRFGAVWYTSPASTARPLDDQRIAVRFDVEDATLAGDASVSLVPGTEELELDAVARVNRGRQPVAELELTRAERDGVLGTVQSPSGQRATKLRGWVAALTPRAAARRGVRAHREMVPFDAAADPCPWPTVAVIDDPRLTPDRTYQHPVDDKAWRRVLQAIRAASEESMRGHGPPPDDALASREVSALRYPCVPAEVDGSRQTCGRLWLRGSPDRGSVRVMLPDGDVVVRPGDELPLRGWVAIHADQGRVTARDLDELWLPAYQDLIRDVSRAKLADLGDDGADRARAHVADALARHAIRPGDVGRIRFPCFRPTALDATRLATLIRDATWVRVVDPDSRDDHAGVAVIDDGTELSRVVLRHLGRRASRRDPGAAIAATAATAATRAAAPASVPVPSATPAAPPSPPPAAAPPHPLDALAAEVADRLTGVHLSFHLDRVIVDAGRRSPLADLDGRDVVLAGRSDLLASIESARTDTSPWADAAIDALCAHVITVLNVGLTDLTDAGEAQSLAGLLARE